MKFLLVFVILFILAQCKPNSSPDGDIYELLASLDSMDDATLTRRLDELIHRKKRGDSASTSDNFKEKKDSSSNFMDEKTEIKPHRREAPAQSSELLKESSNNRLTGRRCQGSAKNTWEGNDVSHSKRKREGRRQRQSIENKDWKDLEKSNRMDAVSSSGEAKEMAHPVYDKLEVKRESRDSERLAENFEHSQRVKTKRMDMQSQQLKDSTMKANEIVKKDVYAVDKDPKNLGSESRDEAERDYYVYSPSDERRNEGDLVLSLAKRQSLAGNGKKLEGLIDSKKRESEGNNFAVDSLQASNSNRNFRRNDLVNDFKRDIGETKVRSPSENSPLTEKKVKRQDEKTGNDADVDHVKINGRNSAEIERKKRGESSVAVDKSSVSKDYYYSDDYNDGGDDYYNDKEGSENEKKRSVNREGRSSKKWDKWGPWSSCSRSCNGGVQVSWRHCIEPSCPAGEKEVRVMYCNLEPCESSKSVQIRGSKEEKQQSGGTTEMDKTTIKTSTGR